MQHDQGESGKPGAPAKAQNTKKATAQETMAARRVHRASEEPKMVKTDASPAEKVGALKPPPQEEDLIGMGEARLSKS